MNGTPPPPLVCQSDLVIRSRSAEASAAALQERVAELSASLSAADTQVKALTVRLESLQGSHEHALKDLLQVNGTVAGA
jgi:chromosome segregation ATPase